MKKLFVFLTSLALVTLPLLPAGPNVVLAQDPAPPTCPSRVRAQEPEPWACPTGVEARADTGDIQFVSQFGGSTCAVAVQGNYAYIGVGPRLLVLDISNPDHPAVVGQTGVLPGVVQGVAVAGSYAYIVAGGSAALSEHPSAGVAVAGSYAYVAAKYAGLYVINVSDPANPIQVGDCTTGDGDVAIVNISDPASPYEAGHYDTPGDAYDVAVSGSYAYVADYDGGLRVISVADPANPYEVGHYEYDSSSGTQAWGVYVVDDYAYIAEAWGGLRVISVADPSHPILVSLRGMG